MPTTDKIIYVSENTPMAIAVLRSLAKKMGSQAPNPLSDTLLRWTPKGWEVVR
jgi:hypothetical protein